MRSTIIPAQITTVEDKIAGNLNITQVLLLMSPVFFSIALYGVYPPLMNFTWYKAGLIFIVLTLCVLLSIRVKEKLVLEWLIVYIRFTRRPSFYIFDKNDPMGRDMHLPNPNVEPVIEIADSHKGASRPIKSPLSVEDEARFEQLLSADKVSIAIKPLKKGGLHVALEQVEI